MLKSYASVLMGLCLLLVRPESSLLFREQALSQIRDLQMSLPVCVLYFFFLISEKKKLILVKAGIEMFDFMD